MTDTRDKQELIKQCNAYLEWLNTPSYGVGEPQLAAPFMADVARAMLAALQSGAGDGAKVPCVLAGEAGECWLCGDALGGDIETHIIGSTSYCGHCYSVTLGERK